MNKLKKFLIERRIEGIPICRCCYWFSYEFNCFNPIKSDKNCFSIIDEPLAEFLLGIEERLEKVGEYYIWKV